MKKKTTSKQKQKEQSLIIDINSSFYKYQPPKLTSQHSKNSNENYNLNSLSIHNNLFFQDNNNSIQKGLAIPINMLSQDYFNNHFTLQKINSLNNQNSVHSHQIKQEVVDTLILGLPQQQYLINSILLKEDFQSKNDKDQKTKNILRNIGNAQNQFISHSQIAKSIIQNEIKTPEKFMKWIRSYELQNFQQFQQIWTQKKHKVFVRLYKKLCRKFYIDHAIPYILNSRMKGQKTKFTHLKYLFKFLEGIENPKQFNCFKLKYKKANLSN